MLRFFGCITLMLTLVVVPACGDDDSEPSRPEVSDIPAGAVAIIGDETITKAEADRRVAALDRYQEGKQPADQLRKQAMTLLLQQAVYEQEARNQGVRVSDAEVRTRLARVAREQFPDRRAFERFLGRQRKSDLLRQLRLQLLAEKLSRRAQQQGGKPEQYARKLQRQWQDRTSCREEYTVLACGTGSTADSG
jgi:FKBP-type peptidyl-prolyl cis-trans isomerase (trigger factor)